MKRLESQKQAGADLTADERMLVEMKGEDEEQYLLDKLFIETGEDVEDLFLAFKYYKIQV